MSLTIVDRETEFSFWKHTYLGKFLKAGGKGYLYFVLFGFGGTCLSAAGNPRAALSDRAIYAAIGIGTWAFLFRTPLRKLLQRGGSAPSELSAADAALAGAGSAVTDGDVPTSIADRQPMQVVFGADLETARPVGLSPQQRARHVYMVGKSGAGKTTLLKKMAAQEMACGTGVAFLDPHGDAAYELLGTIPDGRRDDVLYFDPTSPTCPTFNPLALPYDKPKLTADIISAIRMFFDSWGPQMDHLLRYGLLTLLYDEEPHTLADLRKLLVNDQYREAIAGRATDEQTREFWQYEWTKCSTSAPAITNKLSEFLLPGSPLQRLFSAKHNALDFPRLMNEGRIFIANLAKGQLGDEPSRLLGGLIATGLQQAALSRASLPEAERRPFALYVDEFQNYVVASFATILSEARKYRLSLTLAHQTIGQIPAALYDTVAGNVGTIVAFAVSADDARRLHREMHRSRIIVRIPASPDCVSLPDFVAHQKQVYQKALGDKWLGMSREERSRFGDATSGFFEQAFVKPMDGHRPTSFVQGIREDAAFQRHLEARRGLLEHTLDVLDRPDLNVEVLRELFTDYEFRTETFPTPDDFLNLRPHYGFARVERAENVVAFEALPPSEPDPAVRDGILARLAREHQPQETPAPPLAPSAPPKPREEFPTRF
jgi:hypothetical protein